MESKKWKDIPCFYSARLSIIKMATPPKAVDKFNVNPIKWPVPFFTERKSQSQHLHGTIKYTELPKQSSAKKQKKKKQTNRRNTSPRLQVILLSYRNQDSLMLVQKHTYRWKEENRGCRNKPKHLWSIDFDKGGKKTNWENEDLFSNWSFENCLVACK